MNMTAQVEVGKTNTVLERRNEGFETITHGMGLEAIDFDVVAYPIAVGDYEIPDKKAIFRIGENGGNSYLATVSDSYPIIKYSDVVRKLEEGMNFSNAEVKTIVSQYGGTMQRIYTLRDYAVDVARGDTICPSIRVINSYNGSLAVGFFVDAVRLVCTNGMIACRQFMSMNYKHFGAKFNINEFGETAKKLLQGFDAYSRNWTKWVNDAVTVSRANLLLEFMPARLVPYISKRMETEFNGTKWGLYNAYTAAMTHDYAPSRAYAPESQKINLSSNITKMFANDWYWNSDESVLQGEINKKRNKKVVDEDMTIDTTIMDGDPVLAN
jgi:hypothetical protein